MTFAWPLALAGLIAIPILAGLYVLAARRRRRGAERFANPALVPNLVAASPGWRRHVAPILALAALALLVVGVARPHVVRDVTRDEATIVLDDRHLALDGGDRRPADAVRGGQAGGPRVPGRGSRQLQRGNRLLLDLGRSGAPADDRPRGGANRARRAPARLRHGDRDAITRSVDLALDRKDAQAKPQAGERSPAAVLLLSDGAQTAGDIRPGPAAQRARRLGVPVSTVALGTGNAVVEVPRPGGLKERVVVAPDVQTLRVIARTTGGSFSEAPSAARLQSVYRELGTRLARDRKRVEVTSAFAAGGAVLLLVGSTLSSLWFRRAL